MKFVILMFCFLIGTSAQEVLDQKCFENFMASRNDSNCDFKTFKTIKKQLDAVFEEIYGNLPVNVECIKNKTIREEFNLTFSIMHVWNDDLQEVDKREILEEVEKLFKLILNKILTCYDSKTFLEKSLAVYENLEDEKIKNCIIRIAKNETLDEECSKLIEVIYEAFHIDEIFLESSNVIGVESIIYDIKKCLNATDDKTQRTVGVLKAISSENNREKFDKFYVDSIQRIIDCFNKQENMIPVNNLAQVNQHEKANLNFSSFFQFLLSVNFFLIIFFLFLILLLFMASFEGRDRYRYVRIQ
jgi:hypothetical protein